MSSAPVTSFRPESWLKLMKRKDDQLNYAVEFLMFEQEGGIIGLGFRIQGLEDSLLATFSDQSWWILEDEKGKHHVLDDLLARGLRVHDSDRQSFVSEWKRLFEVYLSSRRASPPKSYSWSELKDYDWGRAVIAKIEDAIGKFGTLAAVRGRAGV